MIEISSRAADFAPLVAAENAPTGGFFRFAVHFIREDQIRGHDEKKMRRTMENSVIADEQQTSLPQA